MESTGQEEQKPERPKQVLYAVYLIYATIAAGILYFIVNGIILFPVRYTTGVVCFQTIGTVISIWITVKIAAGRNWARLLYLVWFIIRLFDVIALVQNIAADPMLWSAVAISRILELIALVLLFKSPSNAWFKKNKKTGQISTKESLIRLIRQGEEVLVPSGIAGLIGGFVSTMVTLLLDYFFFRDQLLLGLDQFWLILLAVGWCMISLVGGPALGVAGGRVGAFATRNTEQAFIHRRGQLIGGFLGGLFLVPIMFLIGEYTQ